MKIPSDNLGIAHLGLNFWRQMAAANESNQALLLCLRDDGALLADLLLTHKKSISSGWLENQARVCLAASLGASTLVRVQKYPLDYFDPLQIRNRATHSLYDAANLYALHMVEVVLPCYMDMRKN